MAVKTAPYDPARHVNSPWAQAELRPELHEVVPNSPWFIHHAPGGVHARHHPTPEWIARFHGQFDEGIE